MKTNELMIGDWVFVHKPTCNGHRVDYINEMEEEIGADGEIYDVCDIKPIFLTLEILEKNEFECRGAWCLPGEDLGLRQDGDSWGLLSHYFDYYALAFCHIEYVHELQHALRLCGIEKTIEL